MVVEIHNKPIYVVSILTQHTIFVNWHDVLCTTHIDRAITKANEWLDKGVDVSIKTWITEIDSETCTLGVEKNEVFVGDEDGIVMRKERIK